MTPGTWVIIELLGAVALLLWGVRMVRTGIMRAWGAWLKRFIEDHLSGRLTAFATGIVATIFLQSGTATALIITGLAAGGVIKGATGLAVLLGADLGSSLVTAVFAFGGPKIAGVSYVLLFAGFLLFSVTSEFRPRNAGRILMGLGMMLLALKLIVMAGDPVRDAPLFKLLLARLGSEPILAVMVGALLTWMSYSTLAIMLLIASFVSGGVITVDTALALIVGVNLGGGLPAMTATAGQPAVARRLPLANLLCRAAFAIASIPLLPVIADAASRTGAGDVLQAAGFHVAFNLALAVLALPLAGLVMTLTTRLYPDGSEPADPLQQPRYLDPAALETPGVALSNAQSETVRMTELIDQMLVVVAQGLTSGSLEALKSVKQADARVNSYQNAIHGYVAEVTQSELSEGESRQALEIMLYVSNLEHAGDIIHLNLADRLKAKSREAVQFDAEQHETIQKLCDIIRQSLKLAGSVLLSRDIEGARRLIDQKHTFRSLENELFQVHFSEGSTSDGPSLRASALFVDMVRDLHAINSHIASAAYPIVEDAGLLRDTRLRRGKKKK